MRQALHIFRKDTRQFRYLILILLAWTVVFAVSNVWPWWPEPDDRLPVVSVLTSRLATYLFPVGWCYLIAQVFHAEALPGVQQFWLTRPYRRGSLLAAKALFLLTWLTLPMTLAQAAIVTFNGLPLVPNLAGLIWEQVLLSAILVVPAATLAALTCRVTQFMAALLMAPALLLVIRLLRPWQGFEWIRLSVVITIAVATAIAALALQFKARRTSTARTVGLAGLLAIVATLPVLPFPAAFALQAKLESPLDQPIAIDFVRREPKTTEGARSADAVQLHFRVSGTSEGMVTVCEAVQVAVSAPDGSEWRSPVITGRSMLTAESECAVGLPMPGAFLDAVGTYPVTLRARLYLTIFGPEQSTVLALDEPPVPVEGLGVCAGRRPTQQARVGGPPDPEETVPTPRVECRSAFREPAPLLRRANYWIGRRSFSPFPAEFRWQPVSRTAAWYPADADNVTLTTREPTAHVRATVEANDVYLRNFEFGR